VKLTKPRKKEKKEKEREIEEKKKKGEPKEEQGDMVDDHTAYQTAKPLKEGQKKKKLLVKE
jgi:hypothetical protein